MAGEADGADKRAETRATSDEPPVSTGIAMRMARVAGDLLKVHVELAKVEARRDRKRLISALFCGVLGALLLGMVIFMLEAAAIVVAHDHGRLAWHLAILAVAGGNLVLGSLLLLVASHRLRAPIMPETRGLVQKTFATMTEV